MPAVQVVVDLNQLKALRRRFDDIVHNLVEIEPLLRDIGTYMMRSSKNRIYRQLGSPDGEPWAPLAPSTVDRKGHGRILFDSGEMARNIYFESDDDSVEIVSPAEYSEYMQEGFRHKGGVDVPARPFMGFSDENLARIRSIVDRHIRQSRHGG